MTRSLARTPLSFTLRLAVLLLLPLAPAAAIPVEQIPTPRPARWVVDLTGILPGTTVADLNRLGDEVNAQTGGGLAIAVIGSTDGANPRDFASQLFNQWEIGSAQWNNGVLLFVALDDRKAEIILGKGMQAAEYVQVSEGIMQGEVVPRFRDGNAPGAVYQGALACARQLFGATPTAASEAPSIPSPTSTVPLATPGRYPTPLAYEPPPGESGTNPGKAVPYAVVVAILAGLLAPGVLRRLPRRCDRCRARMVRLSEDQEDAHLSAPERFEEQIGSVDYDVWACLSCGQTLRRRHDCFASGYSSCPRCQAKTVSEISTVLEDATYEHGGRIRVDERCAYCSYESSTTHRTPRLHPLHSDHHSSASTSSSLYSSSSDSSSSSSSSDSSSSSGSSSGGGSTSGSGASGSW